MDNPSPGRVPRNSYTRYSVMMKTLKYLGGQVEPYLPALILGGFLCVGFTILANSLEKTFDKSSRVLASSVDLGRPDGFKAGISGTRFQIW